MCTPPSGARLVYDKRVLPTYGGHCPASSLIPTIALESSSKGQGALLPQGALSNTQFTFTISNGHTATAYLAAGSTWDAVFGSERPAGYSYAESNPDVSITHEDFPSNHGVRQLPLHSNYCEMGLHYIREYWWPNMKAKVLRTTEPAHGPV